MEFIISDARGLELGYMDIGKDIDMDIGDTNDYQIEISKSDWNKENYNVGYRFFCPDTEYGGIFQTTDNSSNSDIITITGDIWRGMLSKKIIEPPSGQAYKTVTGDANSIIRDLITNQFDEIFEVPQEESGIAILNYSFDRYTDYLSGFTKMLLQKNARLDIKYKRGAAGEIGHVELKAVPIETYKLKNQVEFSVKRKNDGINHLICLGAGELQERQVIHLYIQNDGSIGSQKYYTGLRERTAVYDYGNAESETELVENGKKRLEELRDYTEIGITVQQTEGDIGDIITEIDPDTSIPVTQKITGKIIQVKNKKTEIEYRTTNVEGEV